MPPSMTLALRPRPSMVGFSGLRLGTASVVPSASAAKFQKRNITLAELDAQKGDRERILIIGSGWSGFSLSRLLSLKHYQPLLLTPRTYFAFTPLLASTAAGTLEFRTAMESSRSREGVEVIRGWAEDVDFVNKSVRVQGAVESGDGEWRGSGLKGSGEGYEVRWDKVVVAVGAYVQTFGVEGVREWGLFLKDVGDARRIRRRVLECFEEAASPTASEERKRQLLHFAVVGGGPTGVELSAELHDLITEDLNAKYPSLRSYSRITVYDISPRILNMFDESLASYASTVFRRQGITIKTSHNVQKVMEDSIVTKEEGVVPTGCVVWSTGLAKNPLVSNVLLKKAFRLDDSDKEWMLQKHEKTGNITVDKRLRVKVHNSKNQQEEKTLENVFALGDCASVGEGLPATAQVADQQARWLAKVLNHAASKNSISPETGKIAISAEKEFKFRSLGVMAYLGGWKAITQSGGNGKDEKVGIRGRLAWFLWRTAYLSMSVSWRNRLLIPVYWFVSWALGRDINRF